MKKQTIEQSTACSESAAMQSAGTYVSGMYGDSAMDLHPEVLQGDDAKSQRTPVGTFNGLICSDTSFDLHMMSDAPKGLRGAGEPAAPPVRTFQGFGAPDVPLDLLEYLNIDTNDAPNRSSRTIAKPST